MDESGGICFDLSNSALQPDGCSINWTAVLRPANIANGLNESVYVVAITAEDFADASSTTSLSSTPHQVLIHVYTPPSHACSTIPAVVAYPRGNQACFGVTVNSLFTFIIEAKVNCVNDKIVEFITSSPFTMQKMNMTQVANDAWSIAFSWTPQSNQTGVQPFCVAAIDNHGVSSTQYCMAMADGASGTIFITPAFVQGSASPIGTVMPTQTRFSIQANIPIKRTSQDGTEIRIYQNAALIYWLDVRNSPDIFYFNETLVFFVRDYAWIPCASYYVVLSEGVATADEYCGMESPAYWNSLFWSFTIWDSSKSPSITPSTTTSITTTHTVITRGMGTTAYNILYTTTGIPAYTTFTVTSTTDTTSTSVTITTTTSETTTTTSTTTATEYIPNAEVIYPKDMEQQCLQPITIATAVITHALIPLHLCGMMNLFVKMNSHLQKEALEMRDAHRIRYKNLPIDNEEDQIFV